MADVQVFRFQPQTLTRLSQVKICQCLWTHFKIKDTIMQFIKNSLEGLRHFIEREKILELENQVINNIVILCLPPALKHNLKILAKKMSSVVFNMLLKFYIETDLSEMTTRGQYLAIKHFVNHIEWTVDGDIDKDETLRSMYYAKLLPDDNSTWELLTEHCLQDCIVDFFKRIQLKDNKPPEWLGEHTAMELYWSYRLQKRLEEFSSFLTSFSAYQESYSLEENLAILFGYDGCSIKYFLNLLNKDQQIRTITIILENPLITISATVPFLKKAFIYGFNSVVTAILTHSATMKQLLRWPYDHLLMIILEELPGFVSDSVLEKMTNMTCEVMNELSLELDDIFIEIWRRIGPNHKSSMDCSLQIRCFRNNVKMLKYLFDDSALRAKRDKLLEYAVPVSEELLDEFCNVILESQEERENFRAINFSS